MSDFHQSKVPPQLLEMSISRGWLTYNTPHPQKSTLHMNVPIIKRITAVRKIQTRWFQMSLVVSYPRSRDILIRKLSTEVYIADLTLKFHSTFPKYCGFMRHKTFNVYRNHEVSMRTYALGIGMGIQTLWNDSYNPLPRFLLLLYGSLF